jgi:uncharacterized membrane protein
MTGSARRPIGSKTLALTGYAATVSPLGCVELVNELGEACLADVGTAAAVAPVEEPSARGPIAALLLAYAVQLAVPGAGSPAGALVTLYEALGVLVLAQIMLLTTGEETRFAVPGRIRPGTLGRTGPSGGSSSGPQGLPTDAARRRSMKPIQQVIEVRVPVHTAYEQLSRFECYPQFMTGVQEVRQVSDDTTHWVMDLDGRRTEFDAKITECTLDERVAWKAMGSANFSEALTLRPVAADRTEIIAELEADAQALLPSDKQAKESLKRRLKADLTGFKRYVEGDLPALAASGSSSGSSSVQPMKSQGRSAAAKRGRSSMEAQGPAELELETREGSADL